MPDTQQSSDKCITYDKQILLAEPLILAEFDLSVVTVSIPSTAPRTDILCMSQNSPCKNIQFESVLSTVDANGLFV